MTDTPRRVRTRFAPSPTGFLHIGGLRTALFAYLFARHHGGEFVLRIEDTDRTRLVEGAYEDILQSLRWIGIRWDEGPDIGGPCGPYVQSERRDMYREQARFLVASGHAYRCYCTPERLRTVREEQRRRGLDPKYDRRCRALPDDERKRMEGQPSVIRFAAPEGGDVTFRDALRGEITTSVSVLDDFVLLKSDGYPTYHLANVVDDHHMAITHVIRGEEWISSTPRHVMLYTAFGWDMPRFAHVPVILAPGGGKLSKRHGAVMVSEFVRRGYLSEAVLNFIALLGWSLDDRTEIFDMESLVESFDIDAVNRAPAVFSYEKLDWFNGVYIRSKSTEELLELLLPYWVEGGLLTREVIERDRPYLLRIVPLIRERLSLLSDVSDLTWFFFDDSFEIRDPEALTPKKLSRENAERVLLQAHAALSGLDPFTEKNLESALRGLVDRLSLKTGQVFMTIRVAVTGSKVSPGLFETLSVLGRDRTLNRLRSAVDVLKKPFV